MFLCAADGAARQSFSCERRDCLSAVLPYPSAAESVCGSCPADARGFLFGERETWKASNYCCSLGENGKGLRGLFDAKASRLFTALASCEGGRGATTSCCRWWPAFSGSMFSRIDFLDSTDFLVCQEKCRRVFSRGEWRRKEMRRETSTADRKRPLRCFFRVFYLFLELSRISGGFLSSECRVLCGIVERRSPPSFRLRDLVGRLGRRRSSPPSPRPCCHCVEKSLCL